MRRIISASLILGTVGLAALIGLFQGRPEISASEQIDEAPDLVGPLAVSSCPMAHCSQGLIDQMPVDAILGPVSTEWHFQEKGSGTGLGASAAPDFLVATFKGNTAYGEKNVYAFNFDGTVRWTSAFLNGRVATSAPLIDKNSNVYLADNNLAVKFAPDGKTVWWTPHPGGGAPTSFNVTDEGFLVGADATGIVWLMNRDTGRTVAATLLTDTIEGKPGVFFTRNSLGVSGTRVYLLTDFMAGDGRGSRPQQLGGPRTYGRLYAIETAGGNLSILWRFDFGGPSGGSPTVIRDGAGDRIYFDGRTATPTSGEQGPVMFGVRDDGDLYSLLWAVDLGKDAKGGKSITASPALDPRGGLWVFAILSESLLRLDELSGGVIDKLNVGQLIGGGQTGYTPSSVMTIALNRNSPVMYVGAAPASGEGIRYVMAIRLADRVLDWKYELGDSSNHITNSQMVITQPSATQSKPLLIVPTSGNGLLALTTDGG